MDSATPTSNHITLFAPSLPQANKFGIGAKAAAHLIVTITPYAAMDEGDLITLFWDGCYVASKLLAIDDIGQPLTLRVPESFVQSGTVSSWYQVQKIGNTPATSPDKKVLIKLDCPGGNLTHNITEQNQSLAPPTLSDRQPKNGVMVTIEAYENMAAQDEITLRWGDLRMDLPALNAQNVGKPITLNVPPAMILEAGDDSSLEITYCVIDLVGNNSRWAPIRALSIPTSV
jgi:hypothetical protein